jgi:hypothetical protein
MGFSLGDVGGFFEDVGPGALSGAATGFVATGGNPYGALAGAGVGGTAGYFQAKANKKKQKGMAEARKEMQELQRKQYAQRMADLERAMGYFKPANDRLRRLYGSDAAVDYVPPKQVL